MEMEMADLYRRESERTFEGMGYCKGNPNSLDKQLFSQDLVMGNPK
jgi:hypothetical protein